MNDQATLNQLREDLRAVARDVEALLNATAAETSEKIRAARDRVSESLQHAKSRLDEAEGTVFTRARESADKATEFVKQNPWKSVGFIGALGVALGMLLKRR